MKTWLITGCSSGLGRSLAEAVLATGDNAVVTSRDAQRVRDLVDVHPQAALACALDVKDKASIARAVAQAQERFGAVDVLVNNAGYGYRGAIEEASEDEIADEFDTNLFGAIGMMQAVLPGMRERRSGTIVNISSIAAEIAMPGSGFYSATKRALEGVTEALRREVAPLGIRTLVVEPGAFRTDFAGRSLKGSANEIADYAETVGPRRKQNDDTDGTQPGDPERAARAIIEVLERDELPERLLLGSDAVRIVRRRVQERLDEIDAWKTVSEGTDFRDK